MTLAEIALAFLALWGWAGLLVLRFKDTQTRASVTDAMMLGPIALAMQGWIWWTERR